MNLLENDEWKIVDRSEASVSKKWFLYHKSCWKNNVYGQGYVYFGPADPSNNVFMIKEQRCTTCGKVSPIKFQKVREFFKKVSPKLPCKTKIVVEEVKKG